VKEGKTWQGKTDGGNFGQKSLFFYFKYGSIRLSYAIMSLVIIFYLIFNYKAAKNIYNYFRKRHKYSVIKSLLNTYLNHYLFGKTLIDKFAMFAGRRDEYAVEVSGQELFTEAVNNVNSGTLILNSHIGSAEIAGYLLSQNKKKFNAVVYGGEASAIQEYRTKILTEHNICLIPVIDSFSHIFAINNAINNAELIGMASDRIYEGSKNKAINFLESKALFPIGSFQLAVKMKIPILSLFVMQSGYKKYHCYIHKIDIEGIESYTVPQQIELLMQQYVLKLELMVKRYPLQWYNFHQFWIE